MLLLPRNIYFLGRGFWASRNHSVGPLRTGFEQSGSGRAWRGACDGSCGRGCAWQQTCTSHSLFLLCGRAVWSAPFSFLATARQASCQVGIARHCEQFRASAAGRQIQVSRRQSRCCRNRRHCCVASSARDGAGFRKDRAGRRTGDVSGGAAPDLRASEAFLDDTALEHILREGALSQCGMPRFKHLSDDDIRVVKH